MEGGKMGKEKGKDRFLGLIEDILHDQQSRGGGYSIELGTYKKGGVLPDSYPDRDGPEEDYYSFFHSDITAGDRVLVIWTDDDDPDMIAIGPLKSEGGDEDA